MARFLYLLAILSYMISSFFPKQPVLHMTVSVLSMLAVLISLRFVKGLALIFGLFFLIGGGAMLVWSGSAPIHFISSFGEMIQMVTLFALIPILSIPIRFGNYADEVHSIIRKRVKSATQLYMLTSAASYFFSSFMNLAALPMTYYSISSSVKEYPIDNKKRYLSRAITHGYAMPLLWSPVTPIVGTVLYLTGTAYSKILPFLLVMSIGGLLLDWVSISHPLQLFRRRLQWKRAKKETAASLTPLTGGRPARLFHILAAIILLNALITLLDHFFSFSFLFLVSLIVIPFAFLWCILIGQGKPFFPGVVRHFQTYIPKMQNQFFIFLSAGFFITALNVSGADTVVTQWVNTLIHFSGIRIFLILLPLIPFALAFIGLHPAIGLALISAALHSDLLNKSPIVVTVAMLGGAIPAFLMGPYNATLGMMSSIINEKPIKLSNWNFPFTCLYLVLLTLFVQLLYLL
ncbi:hypothetical protein E4665_02675 [Sporolactobacillus shoreae]|uniref:Citrate transporter-like domain-containing protein n=1 Tax=Sporolactobacillus shoreae TaxID=1465501 RepID=A0A4Z0GRA1_9BACL|nr:hypothetical protein [Sporolactobacillus shoreae]TGA99870.1 hypothetical protein E4665_02675 [Sporolactobacillus shoreae]